ncbi:NADPH-nitrite reductase [Aeromicrobium ponti]|uniref:Nitrite reductase (NADH) large subunit n=1 Tax=Cytobacillus oceanisediminis TaxID=665099 RepID=A0A562JRR9_9BACI|nr:nitrite reductase large subunit NirB [Cytobacillus oceanisediminis]TWH85828.1 nitrite reductase (NADH) large subunit [Cytobacillus oceanisediminis]
MAKEKLVLIGNGMAGIRCVEEILHHDPGRFSISVFGSEKHLNYNRILLSSILQGKSSIENLTIHKSDWYVKNQIELFKNETVMKLNTAKKKITTNKNRKVSYDRLILATGSTPYVPPLPGCSKEGVMTFRTIEDCRQIIHLSKKGENAVVLGGGLLGLEAAQGLIHLGMDVHVVHNEARIMNKQLDSKAANLLQRSLEEQGINFLLEKETLSFEGSSRVERVIFKDRTELPADLVIIAAGVRPNIKLAHDCGIKTNRGIMVNDFMQTSIPDIYAVGECAEHRGMVYGLVKPLYEQGKVLAKHICGKFTEEYKGSILSSKLKISGTDVFSAGELFEKGYKKALTLYDEDEQTYKKIVFKHNKMAGFLLMGDIKDHVRLLDMMEKKKDFSDEEKLLLLNSSKKEYSISSMAQTSIVCNCNGVTKKAIAEAVLTKGLKTAEEVKECTKASGTCGGCKPLVEELLHYIKSDDFHEDIEPDTLCTCTDLSEEEVVEKIQLRGLRSVEGIFTDLGWRKENGCPICVPALHYILRMTVPDYEGDGQSVFAGETHNAVREANGTYTIKPQIYLGETNSSQLQKIAAVAEQYSIPEIVLSNDGRIMLKGIQEEDLQRIWQSLDMKLIPIHEHNSVSITLLTGFKGCGCENGTSKKLAVQLQKKTEYLVSPNRLEIGIASCIHGSAGFGVKDIGVIKLRHCWEIYIGGNAGIQLKAGELLAIASTEKEAEEVICTLVQYFRESAKYLESVSEWTERIGLIHLREVVFDLELRKLLIQRLVEDSYNCRHKLPVFVKQ